MKKKTFLPILTIILSFFNYSFYVEKWNQDKIEFHLVDAISDQSVRNEMLYFIANTLESFHSFDNKIIDSVMTDSNGYFSVSENVFKKGVIHLCQKSDFKNNLKGRWLSVIRYAKGKNTLKILDFIDGYTCVIGNYDYNLKSKLVTHNNYRRDTTTKLYDKIKLVRYSKSKIVERRKKVESLLNKKFNTKELLNETWNFAYEEIVNASKLTNRNFEEIDLLTGCFSGSISWILHKNRKIDLNSVIEIIDESSEVRKKYNFLYIACLIINYDLERRRPINNNQVDEILNRIDEFHLQHADFIDNKKKYFTGNHCHHLQRIKGEVLIRTKKAINQIPNFVNCCKVGMKK